MARKIVLDVDEGRSIARSRYGELTQTIPRPSESPRPQDPQSRRANTGNVKQSWITGAAQATNRPGFDSWADRKGRGK